VKNYVILGIGNNIAGTLDKERYARLRNIDPDDVVELSVEAYFDAHRVNTATGKLSKIGKLAALTGWQAMAVALGVLLAQRGVDRFGDWFIWRYDRELFADVIVNLVQQVKPGEPCIITGHSLGSIIALELATRLNQPVTVETWGSPLGSRILGKRSRALLRSGGFDIQGIHNIWHPHDKISGPIPDGWRGFKIDNQQSKSPNWIFTAHDFWQYAQAAPFLL
jgi:pimeloyl-ACP methyl ester carboxylesterase